MTTTRASPLTTTLLSSLTAVLLPLSAQAGDDNQKYHDLFQQNCASCHGVDGKMGNSGAKDLSESTLTDQETINAILYGNEKGMPPFKDQLGSEENITLLLAYVKSLRK